MIEETVCHLCHRNFDTATGLKRHLNTCQVTATLVNPMAQPGKRPRLGTFAVLRGGAACRCHCCSALVAQTMAATVEVILLHLHLRLPVPGRRPRRTPPPPSVPADFGAMASGARMRWFALAPRRGGTAWTSCFISPGAMEGCTLSAGRRAAAVGDDVRVRCELLPRWRDSLAAMCVCRRVL
jgi:hypothetical protein